MLFLASLELFFFLSQIIIQIVRNGSRQIRNDSLPSFHFPSFLHTNIHSEYDLLIFLLSSTLFCFSIVFFSHVFSQIYSSFSCILFVCTHFAPVPSPYPLQVTFRFTLQNVHLHMSIYFFCRMMKIKLKNKMYFSRGAIQ